MPLRPVGPVVKPEVKAPDSVEFLEPACTKSESHRAVSKGFKDAIRRSFQKHETTSESLEERFYPSGYHYHEPLHLPYKIINSMARNGRRWSLSNASERINESLCASNLYDFENKEIKKITTVLPCPSSIKGGFFDSTVLENPVKLITSEPVERSESKGCCYENIYSKHVWIMVSNYKNNSRLHMSNVVRTQYVIASKNGGFYGCLPSVICRSNVISKQGVAFMKKHLKIVKYLSHEHKREIIKEFLDMPGNGRSTQRILNDFDLEAIDIDISPRSIYLHVKKKDNDSKELVAT